MKRILLSLSVVFALGLMAVIASAAVGLQRSDCPGKITCPLTGNQVCLDECPLDDSARIDCPGKITCPIDGKSVCRDRCPLGSDMEATEPNGDCCSAD